jgi:hypothetical protein
VENAKFLLMTPSCDAWCHFFKALDDPPALPAGAVQRLGGEYGSLFFKVDKCEMGRPN